MGDVKGILGAILVHIYATRWQGSGHLLLYFLLSIYD